MIMKKNDMSLLISLDLVKKLIVQQFPEWAYLSIKPVELSGHDNRTFRLGSDMLIRLPSAQRYAAKVAIEQKWLPILAPHISFAIPKPLAMGQPCKDYPFNWSVYQWIEGESANSLIIDDVYLPGIALGFCQFLKELHKIDIAGGPESGQHNFFRGGPLSVYDAETKSVIVVLKDLIDVHKVTDVWQKALSSKWIKEAVWVHGDLSVGNILIKNNQLVGVIDFGGMAIGDPACDLVIAWTFLKGESRTIFKSQLPLDSDTWARARGWALWKALITLVAIQDKSSSEATKQLQIINEVLNDNEMTINY